MSNKSVSLNSGSVVPNHNSNSAAVLGESIVSKVDVSSLDKEQLVALFTSDLFNGFSDADVAFIGEAVSGRSVDVDTLRVIYKMFEAYASVGARPFPMWLMEEFDEVVVVGTPDTAMYQLLDGLELVGANLSSGKHKKDYAVNTVVGDDSGKYSAYVHCEDVRYFYLSSGETAKFNGCTVDVRSAQWVYAATLIRTIEGLSKAQVCDFLSGFGYASAGEGVITLSTGARRGTYVDVVFDFNSLEITTSKAFTVRHKGYLAGIGMFSCQTFMAMLAIQIGGLLYEGTKVNQRTVDGTLSFLTQLWEEEDTYGAAMDADEALRTIRANSLALIRIPSSHDTVGQHVRGGLDRFPFFRMVNANNLEGVAECTDWCMKNNIPFMVDKNASKRVMVGAAVAALHGHMDIDADQFTTILDVKKPGKLLNRGSQTIAIRACEGYEGMVGYRPYVRNAFIETYEGEEVATTGDRVMTLTHSGAILTNGSGVGYSNTQFAYSIPRTLRAEFNGINFREDETMESVVMELTEALTEKLNDTTIYGGNEKVIFEFRGRKLITWNGLNQPFSVNKAHGGSFTVSPLVTSKSISIKLTGSILVEGDTSVKLRGIGNKAMLKNAKSTNVVISEDGTPISWDIALNSECLKGSAARLAQYCEVLKDETGASSYMDLKTQVLRTPKLVNGTVEYYEQDLNQVDSDFYVWWKANTKKYVIEDSISFADFCYVILGRVGVNSKLLAQEVDGGDKVLEALADALTTEVCAGISIVGATTAEEIREVVEANGNGLIRVREEVEGVLAPYVGQVELTSIRESSSRKTSPTLQQLASAYAVNPKFSYTLLQEAADAERAVMGVASMARNDFSYAQVENDPALSTRGKNLEVATKFTGSAAEFAAMNDSWFGIGASRVYHGTSDPFLKFSEPGTAAKFEAKGLVNRVGLSDKMTEGGYSFLDVMQGTAWNYRVNVGTGYNAASVAVFDSVVKRYAVVNLESVLKINMRKGATPEIIEAIKVQLEKAKAQLELVMKANFVWWITAYEDAWLAGFNIGGMDLADCLHKNQRGAIFADNGSVIASRTQVIDTLIEAFAKVSDVSFDRDVMSQVLFYYQVARTISATERYDKAGEFRSAINKYFFTEEEVQFIIQAGCFRRCDQGSYANYTVAETEGETSGKSLWSCLEEIWPEVQLSLPYWLRRKLYLALNIHRDQRDVLRDVKAAKDLYGGSIRTGAVETLMDAQGMPSIIVTPVVEDSGYIPNVYAESCSRDNAEDGTDLFVGGEKTWVSYKNLGGAFEHIEYSCPIDGRINQAGAKRFSNQADCGWGFEPVLYRWTRTLTTGEMFDRAAIRYPKGVILRAFDCGTNEGGDLGVYLDFSAISRAVAISGGGMSTGMGLVLSQFMISISQPTTKRVSRNWSQYVRNAIARINGLLREMLQSSLIKRIGRTTPFAQGAKVMTSHSCPDQMVDGKLIPTIRMNRNDDLIRVGSYREGDWVAVYRTPQIATIYGRLELVDDLGVGLVEVSAINWAFATRGDGDGDPIAFYNVSLLMELAAMKNRGDALLPAPTAN